MIFKNIAKAVVGAAVLPVAVVVDVVTFPAIAEGDRESSTLKVAKNTVKSLEQATEPEKPE